MLWNRINLIWLGPEVISVWVALGEVGGSDVSRMLVIVNGAELKCHPQTRPD